ncbi:MAG: class I SAM-dependent methyltransferase [Jatrophihabitantaceae bacterium]
MGDPDTDRRRNGSVARSVPDDIFRQWDTAYAGVPPWEIGRPQAVFVALAEAGRLDGRLLDVGCGTGETTLLAAAHGANAFGIDLSHRAVVLARAKAAQRGVPARFDVADVLHLDWTGELFDTVIDSGTFHLFDAVQRAAYIASVGAAIRPGGTYYLLCARDDRPASWGPPGLGSDELARSFPDGWVITGVEPATFEVTDDAPVDHVDAWLATIARH